MATTAKALFENRWMLLSNETLSGTAVYSDGISTEGFQQAIVEVQAGTFTGTLSVRIEFSNNGANGPWMPELLDDTSSVAITGNTYAVPARRFVHTWPVSESGNAFGIPVPLQYRWFRVGLTATSGNCTVIAQLTQTRGV